MTRRAAHWQANLFRRIKMTQSRPSPFNFASLRLEQDEALVSAIRAAPLSREGIQVGQGGRYARGSRASGAQQAVPWGCLAAL